MPFSWRSHTLLSIIARHLSPLISPPPLPDMEQLPLDFNPHTQDITIFYPDGTPLIISLAEIDTVNLQSIKLAVVFASQIGACTILLFLLLALTRAEKRMAPIFIFNSFALALVIIRSVLQILYFTGGWYSFFAFYAYYFDDVPRRDYAISIAAPVMALLLHICIMVSLVLQVRVVYSSNPRVRQVMTVVSVLIALTSIGFFFGVTVQNAQAIIKAEGYDTWVYTTSRALLAAAICFFSAVFVVKLGMAIRQRRILGLERWGPLQVIFVVGCQTLFVPGKFLHFTSNEACLLIREIAIFSVLENVVNFDGMASFTSTLVAISLPISSLWASASVSEKSPLPTRRNHTSGSSSHLIKTNNSGPSPMPINPRNGSVSTGSTLVSKTATAPGKHPYDVIHQERTETRSPEMGVMVERSYHVSEVV